MQKIADCEKDAWGGKIEGSRLIIKNVFRTYYFLFSFELRDHSLFMTGGGLANKGGGS